MTSNQPRPFLRRVVVNTVAAGAATGWSIVVSLVALPFLLTGLGPAGFGAWTLLQTFSAFTGWIALLDLGVGTAATRFVSARMAVGDRTGAARLCSATAAVSFGMGVVGGAALMVLSALSFGQWFGLGPDLASEFRVAGMIFAIQVPIDMLSRASQFGLEGANRVDLSRLTDSVRRTTVVTATAVAATLTGSLVWVAAWSLVASALTAVITISVAVRVIGVSSFGRVEVLELLRYGRHVAVLRPLGTLHRMMDRIVVGVVLGPQAVALVEIATQIQNGAEAALSSSAYAVTPTASWLDAREDQATLRSLLIRGTRLSLFVTAPFVIVPALTATAVLALWIGPDGADAAPLVAVALAYTGLTAMAQVSSQLLVGLGRASSVFRAAAVALVLNLVATIALVPTVGVIGAFIGSLVGAPFAVWLLLRAALSETNTTAREFIGDGLAPVVVPALALTAVTLAVVIIDLAPLETVALSVIAGGVVYGALALAREAEHSNIQERLRWSS